MQIKGKQSKEERAWSREGDESALRLGGWGLSCEKRNVRRPNRLNLKCAKLRRRRTGEAAQAMGGCGQCVDQVTNMTSVVLWWGQKCKRDDDAYGRDGRAERERR